MCARMLVEARHRVLVIDAADEPGGRVRTRVTPNGYRIDRGFQVLFASYPALRRHVPLTALAPRYFASSVDIVLDGTVKTLGHPLYDPATIVRTLTSRTGSRDDAVAFMRLLASSLALGDAPLPASNRSALDELQAYGFSPACIDRVFVPLFGGVSLDRTLSSDATFLRMVLRSFCLGRVFLPALGIGQVTRYLAARIPPESLLLGVRVESLLMDERRVHGVRTSAGDFSADAVVVATDAPTAQRLTEIATPVEPRSCTTVYFASDRPLIRSRRLVLHGAPSLVNHIAPLSVIAPEYAPPGRHLLAAVVLDDLQGTHESITRQVRADLRAWCDPALVDGLEMLDVVRVPFSQFAQPPGVYSSLSRSETDHKGLFLAGEYLHSSSVQGAMRGGESAAGAVGAALAG
ncbi:MAG: NAD(P)/FAD-dependent oxidoreductase [Chloroflexota bacterium]